MEVDTTKLNDMCYDLADALGQAGKPADLADVVRDETRRLAVEITKLTPPQTQAIGERAVSNDIKSFFSAADQGMVDSIGSEYGITGIDTWITTGAAHKRLHLLWQRIDPSGNRMAEYANAARTKRGKLRKGPKSAEGEWRAQVVVSKEDRAKYAAATIARVGRWKASWAQVAMQLGVRNVAGWIKRHIPTPKAISETAGLMQGDFPTVTFGSRAPGAARQDALIRSAVRVRQEAMAKRIKLIISGYSKDLARGMRIQAREKRSGNGGNYAIG